MVVNCLPLFLVIGHRLEKNFRVAKFLKDGLVFSFNDISTFVGYLMRKTFLQRSNDNIKPIAISQKVNVIMWIEFKHDYLEAAVQLWRHGDFYF